MVFSKQKMPVEAPVELTNLYKLKRKLERTDLNFVQIEFGENRVSQRNISGSKNGIGNLNALL